MDLALLLAALILCPLLMYCLGLILRSWVSSLILDGSVRFATRIGLFVCADVLSLLVHLFGGYVLLDLYVLPFVNEASARYDLAICQGPRLCVLYWSFYGLSDLIGVLCVFLLYTVLVKMARLQPVRVSAKAKFVAAYIGLAATVLIANYFVYPYIEIVLRDLGPEFPRGQG